MVEFAAGKLPKQRREASLLNDPGPNRTADLPLRRRPLYPLSYRTVVNIYIMENLLSTYIFL